MREPAGSQSFYSQPFYSELFLANPDKPYPGPGDNRQRQRQTVLMR